MCWINFLLQTLNSCSNNIDRFHHLLVIPFLKTTASPSINQCKILSKMILQTHLCKKKESFQSSNNLFAQKYFLENALTSKEIFLSFSNGYKFSARMFLVWQRWILKELLRKFFTSIFYLLLLLGFHPKGKWRKIGILCGENSFLFFIR